jgi:N-acetylglutamate synthase-like GNAT family acetyltransferase
MPSHSVSTQSIASRTVVRALEDGDLAEAALILRLAFGTFLGAPDPSTFWDDRDYVYGRHLAPHVAGFGASLDGKLIGSNFATRWGSVGFFGPLSVRPELQESGIARKLLDRTMAQFHSWDSRHVGLFTFAQSAKHIALYQKYGFYPRFLTAIMAAPVGPSPAASGWSRFSDLYAAQRDEALTSCRVLTDKLYPGLDLADEIRATHEQGLGDTVLIEGVGGLAGFAVCHYGPKSEAGADCCFIKFAAVRDSATAERDFGRLLDACAALARTVNMPNLLAGTNLARPEAYKQLVSRGFRTAIQGVAMHWHNDPGYCRPGVYIIDDWR